MSDSDKLRTLSKWFDIDDQKKGNYGHEIQDDLLTIASHLESQQEIIRKISTECDEWLNNEKSDDFKTLHAIHKLCKEVLPELQNPPNAIGKKHE